MLSDTDFAVADSKFKEYWDARQPSRDNRTYLMCRDAWLAAWETRGETQVDAPEFADTAADVYDLAGQRYNEAQELLRRSQEVAAKLVDAARTEYDEAAVYLSSFEEKPGVPKPQYRRSHA
jgi:hypothetical protein